MDAFELTQADDMPEADFAVTVDTDDLAPFFARGRRAYFQRRCELADGDVGLFYSREGMVLRQFCEDGRGCVYLFSLDRSRRELDRFFEPGEEMPVCYGKLLLPGPIALPSD